MNENVLKWLTPLGFLGLLGLIILLIIYLLKPNYQQKFVSATYVWKLSLKYRKKRLPTSRIRNLLIIICQVLIITIGAFLLAQPVFVVATENDKSEKIVILDASASMLAHGKSENDNSVRFDKAVAKIKELRQTQQGLITVILADNEPSVIRYGEDYTAFRSGPESTALFNSALDALTCTYQNADIDGAIRLAEEVLAQNPSADVILYTATKCADYGDRLIVEYVSGEDEYNAAILNATATFEEGYYTFAAEVACYGQNADLKVFIEVYGANAYEGVKGVDIFSETSNDNAARCDNNESVVVYFRDLKVTSFEKVQFYIQQADSFAFDNAFFIYGGTKETIKILYSSSLPNTFFNTVIASMREVLKPRWNISPTQYRPAEDDEFEFEGYDFYMFEHNDIPEKLPKDGVVLIANPESVPKDLEITFGDTVNAPTDSFQLSEVQRDEGKHPIMSGINPEKIFISQYKKINSYENFEPLMFCGPQGNPADPVLLVRNQPDSKIVVLSFNINYSDLAITPEFPILMFNIFNYFMPFTVTNPQPSITPRYIFDIGERVGLNARGTSLTVALPDGTEKGYNSFPDELTLSLPGTYTLQQNLISLKTVTETFFVKVSTEQSNFSRVQTIKEPVFPLPPKRNWDLLIYFASTLVALLLFERLLQSREA